MARYTGPVCRLCRRDGTKLFLKGAKCFSEKCPVEKRNFPPGQHGQSKKVKKVVGGGHHGGAWKIAYADFVTAMMAFFLLMWLINTTTPEQKRGIADYFAPTLIEMRQNSAGSNGLLGGDSIVAQDNYPHRATQTGSRALTIPRDVTGGIREGEAPRE